MIITLPSLTLGEIRGICGCLFEKTKPIRPPLAGNPKLEAQNPKCSETVLKKQTQFGYFTAENAECAEVLDVNIGRDQKYRR